MAQTTSGLVVMQKVGMNAEGQPEKGEILSGSPLKMADDMYIEGNFRQAESFYAKCADLEAKELQLKGLRGFIHCRLAMKNLQAASEDSKNFLRIFPDSAEAKNTRLFVLLHKPNFREPEKIDKFIRDIAASPRIISEPDPIFMIEQIFICYKADKINEAISLSNEWQSKFGDNFDMCQRMGEMFIDLKRGDKAMLLFQGGVSKGLDRARLWYLRAVAAAMSGNDSVAENSAAKAKKLNCVLPFMKDLDEEIHKYRHDYKNGLFSEIRKIFFPWN